MFASGMRVISGIAGGKVLKAPKGMTVRPTSDKVRGAIFNILVSRHPECLQGTRVLDLFAGTGALGIEALSRGAREVLFVEKDRAALEALAANLQSTGFAAQAKVVARDVEKVLLAELGAFDLVFADPPYQAVGKSRAIASLRDALAPKGVAMLEHDAATESPVLAGLVAADRREYGSTGITFYRRDDDQELA